MDKPKILIVDDNPIDSKITGKLLAISGFTYQIATSAIEAFQLLSDKSFCLIIMDVEMPEIDGLEASKFIRSLNSRYFVEIPIVAVTAHKQEDILKLAVDAKIDYVFSKPFAIDQFTKKIAQLISSRTTNELRSSKHAIQSCCF